MTLTLDEIVTALEDIEQVLVDDATRNIKPENNLHYQILTRLSFAHYKRYCEICMEQKTLPIWERIRER